MRIPAPYGSGRTSTCRCRPERPSHDIDGAIRTPPGDQYFAGYLGPPPVRRSRLITVTNGGDHGVYGGVNKCADKMVNAFLTTDKAPAEVQTCRGEGIPHQRRPNRRTRPAAHR
jgi:hypothetical protein